MFVKLTEAPVEIKITNGVFWSPTGTLPYLQHKSTKVSGFQKIIHYLNNLGYNLADNSDNPLSTATNIDEGFVKLSIYPYFQFLLWCPQNIDATRALYAHRIQFPLNFYTPKKYLAKAENTMRQICGFSFDDPIIKHDIAEIASKAKQCLNLLEERVKANEWLSGKEPGMVDCTIYAFCAILLNHTMPNNSLQVHLQQCPKLANYVQRVTKKYFANEGFNSVKKDSKESNGTEKKFYTGEEQEEDPKQKRKRYIVSAIVATVSMVSFALFKGILAVSYDNEEAPDFMDYDDDGGEGGDDGE